MSNNSNINWFGPQRIKKNSRLNSNTNYLGIGTKSKSTRPMRVNYLGRPNHGFNVMNTPRRNKINFMGNMSLVKPIPRYHSARPGFISDLARKFGEKLKDTPVGTVVNKISESKLGKAYAQDQYEKKAFSNLVDIKSTRAKASQAASVVARLSKQEAVETDPQKKEQIHSAITREKSKAVSLGKSAQQKYEDYAAKYPDQIREIVTDRYGNIQARRDFARTGMKVLASPVTGTQRLAKQVYKGMTREYKDKAGSKKFGRSALNIAQAILPAGVVSVPRGYRSERELKSMSRARGSGQRYSSSRGKGRPSGTVKYYIPGVGPVGVFEYRKYLSRQRMLQRIAGQEQPQATMSPQDQQRIQQAQQYQQTTQNLEQMPTDAQQTSNEPSTGDFSGNQGQYQQQYQTQQRVVQARQYSPEDQQLLLQAKQRQLQQDDNILHAPNITKGELIVNRPKIKVPNILDAPNFMEGKMRNINPQKNDIGKVNEFGEVQMFDNTDKLNPNKPISNPQGNVYQDINVANGQPLIRKRPQEKWMDGRAL